MVRGAGHDPVLDRLGCHDRRCLTIGLGGGIYWALRGVRPANELVRVCMWCLVLYAAVAIVLVGAYWLDRLRYPIGTVHIQ